MALVGYLNALNLLVNALLPDSCYILSIAKQPSLGKTLLTNIESALQVLVMNHEILFKLCQRTNGHKHNSSEYCEKKQDNAYLII